MAIYPDCSTWKWAEIDSESEMTCYDPADPGNSIELTNVKRGTNTYSYTASSKGLFKMDMFYTVTDLGEDEGCVITRAGRHYVQLKWYWLPLLKIIQHFVPKENTVLEAMCQKVYDGKRVIE